MEGDWLARWWWETVTCPSFTGHGGPPQCIFVRCLEASGRVYVERVASVGKKNLRTEPVVTTSQSVVEKKCPDIALEIESRYLQLPSGSDVPEIPILVQRSWTGRKEKLPVRKKNALLQNFQQIFAFACKLYSMIYYLKISTRGTVINVRNYYDYVGNFVVKNVSR